VDCLDALASDRQYRRALPLEEALAAIVAEAGKSYDPRIVEILRENCREWELLTHSQGSPKASRLSREVPTANGDAPAAGFQNAAADDPRRREVLFSIAAARQEAQTLHELTLDLGNTLNLDETLALLDKRLHRLIPYDAIAVYLRQDDRLVPRYVNGEDGSLFSSLRIPVGQGLSGWVADAGKPILNGNPAVEPGYLNDPSKSSHLRSALAVPLENASGIMGVLTLYRLRADGFTNDHLRTMLALKPKVSLIIENALHFHQAATSATVDALTSLPNAHSLLAHLDTQLVSCRRNNSVLAVLVCDLDGLKQVSDRFGQQLGNQALKMVAAGLRTCCRESDFVGRMGGDEFVLVMPGFKKEYLPEKLHALERMAVEAGVAVAGEPVLHISIGAAFCPEDGTARESLLAEAGRRMYLARHGRVDGGAPSMEDLAELAARVQHPSEHAAHSPLLK
jgi:diguanylate cyclase (GGDEF)-like protein